MNKSAGGMGGISSRGRAKRAQSILIGAFKFFLAKLLPFYPNPTSKSNSCPIYISGGRWFGSGIIVHQLHRVAGKPYLYLVVRPPPL